MEEKPPEEKNVIGKDWLENPISVQQIVMTLRASNQELMKLTILLYSHSSKKKRSSDYVSRALTQNMKLLGESKKLDSLS